MRESVKKRLDQIAKYEGKPRKNLSNGGISLARVHEVLRYDPWTGLFTWATNRSNVKAGAPAGCINTGGYLVIRIDRRLYFGHRLACLIMTGEWPPNDVDHANGDPGDNRWKNLRIASPSQNCFNRDKSKTNRTGVKGVYYFKSRSKWVARIRVGYKTITLGYFDTVEEAGLAYVKAAEQVQGGFAFHQREETAAANVVPLRRKVAS